MGSPWGSCAPKPDCCLGAAGSAYDGEILEHPFLAPTLYPVDREQRRQKMPLLSLCVGPCGAVNQLFCCHLAQVCLLQGPDNTWYGLRMPCTLCTGLCAVASLGLVSPGFPVPMGAPSLAPWCRDLSACATFWCCHSPSLYTLAQGTLF